MSHEFCKQNFFYATWPNLSLQRILRYARLSESSMSEPGKIVNKHEKYEHQACMNFSIYTHLHISIPIST